MIALALMLAQTQPWELNAKWRMFGAANESCGMWLIHKGDEAFRVGQIGWAGGFLSGINLAAGGKMTEVDAASLVAHIDQQCTIKPLQKVAAVAFDFFREARSSQQ